MSYTAYRRSPLEVVRDIFDWVIDNIGMIIVGVLLTGCLAFVGVGVTALIINAVNAPSSGIIKAKDYSPESYIPMTTCSGSGTSTICTTTQTYVPPSWTLDLYNEDSKKEGWVWVTEDTYDNYNVGQFIDLTGK